MNNEFKINENVTTSQEKIGEEYESKFKVATNTNLPATPSFFTKLKNALFYEIKIELTPYEQKIENEINDFLHQEVTWKGFVDFLFQDVEITHRGKRIL